MTNKEIAKQLGISPAALSLIINHKPGVSDATREAVLEQLQEMGLGHLIKKTPVQPANHIAFIIYKRHGKILDLHPFFLLLMENIETQARTHGYNILLYTIDKRRPLESQLEHLNELDCQGAILFATEMDQDDMTALDGLTMPLVVLDNDFTCLPCNTVSINNEMGTWQAISHLVERGMTRIGYLKSSIRISSFEERQRGYEQALLAHQLTLSTEDIIELHYSEEGSYRDMRAYLQTHTDLPEAFVCDDDTIAVGTLRALLEAGCHVPDDLSIVGFNDRPSCEVTEPALSSIHVSRHAFAIEAVDELMRLLQQPASASSCSRKIRIGTKLIQRGSVR